MTADYIVGDVTNALATLPDASVDLILTSPPFLALRSYLPADHPDKGAEMGSEATPAAYLDRLLALAAEWDRVLAPHGSLAVELGDTYAGSGGAGGDYGEDGLRAGQPAYKGSDARRHHRVTLADGRTIQSAGISNGQERTGTGWPLPKSLCMIPEAYALALAYGRNPITGEPSPAGRWRVRNVVAWVRPNPPVGALGDKFRPATSYLTVACRSAGRYFDLDAVREPHQHGIDPATMGGNGYGYRSPATKGRGTVAMPGNPLGAPPLDWWAIPTEPYPGAHYATWPRQLCVRPIEAMCPRRVCRVCGQPSRRITAGEPTTVTEADRQAHGAMVMGSAGRRYVTTHVSALTPTTLGWSDCGHDDWRPGMVLDPFAGSGTTLAVATGHGRSAIGIDLDARGATLATDRVGPLLLTIWTLNEWRAREGVA